MSGHSPAAPELAAVEIHGMSRSSFLLRGALAAAAVYGGAAVGPFVEQVTAQESEGEGVAGDLDILDFAYTLEVLEATFYRTALNSVSGLGDELRALTQELADNEAEHVRALTTLIEDAGGRPSPKPDLDFGDAFSSEESYLRLAQTLEDTGVSAYNGAGPSLLDKKLLAVAGSIVQVEARHAALIRRRRGEPIAPSAFDETLERGEVLRAVEPFMP